MYDESHNFVSEGTIAWKYRGKMEIPQHFED